MSDPAWTPPYTWEERLKYALVPPRLYMWRLLRKHARSGEAELKLLPRWVATDKLAIDIGANKGVYTHTLAKLCRHVHAFEPNPKIHRILTRALPDNATAHRIAVSDRDGEAELVIPAYTAGGYSNQGASLDPRKKEAPFGYGVVRVPARTLDSLSFTNVGFIKIDVEGFEEAVLRGAMATIRRERPVILMELEERHTGRPIEQSLADLAAQGFAVTFVRDGREAPVADLDPEADHRRRYKQPGYVFNFVLRPV
ncbi:MAG: FkbM family methyltransferase [Rhodospirillaceae bacterium]|nr:FkbM family methyltransferase [Rhodospirillaceae bacterium]